MCESYEPDVRWDMHGITDRHGFEQLIIVKGYFHDQVPVEFVDAFKTVEYLQAHFYYWWPMYDEAKNKALRILEMSVKLKAKELNIPLEFTTDKNKTFKKTIYALINEIFMEPYLVNLKEQIHRARKIRNSQMHPETNSFKGGIGGLGKNMELFVLVINELFRENEWLQDHFNQDVQFAKQIELFRNNLLVFEKNGQGILSSGIIAFRLLDETLLLILNPVLTNTIQALSEHRYPNPIKVELSTFAFQDEMLCGTSVEGHQTRIFTTAKPENLRLFENHQSGLEAVNELDRCFYNHFMADEASWSLVKMEYNYLKKQLDL